MSLRVVQQIGRASGKVADHAIHDQAMLQVPFLVPGFMIGGILLPRPPGPPDGGLIS
ncbi:hypothetical protein [Nonomuraea sp. B19D2]|uniref:hypothetical protein n=1 Tax=Nonomuraea sp. B19D2 TaxID=3159561 RepID=UPI0032DAA4A2